MADNQQNTNIGISDPEATKLNKEVAGIMGAPPLEGEPAFKKSDSVISPLRTYKSDFSTTVKEKNIGRIEMVTAEMRKGSSEGKNGDSEFGPKKGVNILLPILVLCALGIVGYLAYTLLGGNKPAPVTKQTAQIPAPLIFSERQENIILKDATKNELEGEVSRMLQKPFPRNNIVYTPIIKDDGTKETYIGLKTFLDVASLNMPVDLAQSLGDAYMMGVYSKNERYPILILKIKLYENAFAGMVAWENKVASDLANIWPVKKTTSSDVFKDKTISNHDIRELDDSEGNLVLIYSFLDRTTLVITTNEDALKAIFERFTFR